MYIFYSMSLASVCACLSAITSTVSLILLILVLTGVVKLGEPAYASKPKHTYQTPFEPLIAQSNQHPFYLDKTSAIHKRDAHLADIERMRDKIVPVPRKDEVPAHPAHQL